MKHPPQRLERVETRARLLSQPSTSSSSSNEEEHDEDNEDIQQLEYSGFLETMLRGTTLTIDAKIRYAQILRSHGFDDKESAHTSLSPEKLEKIGIRHTGHIAEILDSMHQMDTGEALIAGQTW